MRKDKRGKLIVIDGLDGCGKGTQLELLRKKYADSLMVHFTREPGGTPYGEKIRELVLSPDAKETEALTQILLQFAARMEHMKMVGKHLAFGISVISDRLDSSTFAFQINGEQAQGLIPLFHTLRSRIVGPLRPHYIILNLAPEEAHRRMSRDANRQVTHYDLRPLDYHQRVFDGFQKFAEYGECSFINADRSVDEIQKDILILVEDLLVA